MSEGGLEPMPTDRAGMRIQRTYAARLYCGTVLTYEAPSFVPDVGETVPCRRHGFCTVDSREQGDGRGGGNVARAVRRRSQSELLAFLSTRPATSIHTLRQQRFTLRLVTAAQKDGLVDVDLITGRVVLRGRGPRRNPWPTSDDEKPAQQPA